MLRTGGLALLCLIACSVAETAGTLDPSAWGGDHVGQPAPTYVTGGECVFCHRDPPINAWTSNRHSLTMRLPLADAEPIPANGAELLVGAADNVRYLRRTDYGKVALLSADGTHWDPELFATSCAGCHSTAVDPEMLAYSSPSLDCFVCHGDVSLEHSRDPKLTLLAAARQDPPAVVTSICASCHLRGGRSKSSGLPYPNNFIPGDNLFRDFQVDFSDAHLASLSVADRHVFENARDVVLFGKEDVTCLSCHDVHTGSSARHEDVWQQESCFTCHIPGRDKSELLPFTTDSLTCAR